MSVSADVRTEIGQVEIRLIRWIIGTGVVAVLALSAQLWGVAQFAAAAVATWLRGHAMGPILLALALVAAGPAQSSADKPFDWDRYHARQDACAEKDRIAAQCEVERNPVFNSFVRRGVPEGYCDELALRQATRRCSAFGPLEERR